MSNPEQYSTLEVHNNYSQLPEVVDPEQFQKQAVVGQYPQAPPPVQYGNNGQYPNGGQYVNGVPNPYPPADGFYAPVPPHSAHSPSSPYSQATYESHPGAQQNPHAAYAAAAAPMAMGYGGSPSSPSQGPPTEINEKEKKPGRKICGVAPMTFWIALAVILAIIVAAVVGGVVGSQAGSDGDDDAQGAEGSEGEASNADADQSDSNPDTPLLHVNSRLTATNWTGPDGTRHRAVFFQDAYDAIITCQWDSKEKNWQKTNISELLAPSTLPLKPVSGTPLASASIDDLANERFEIRLWYLDPDSLIRSVGRNDGTDPANKWLTDKLDDAFLQTRPGSLLSAAWQRPPPGGRSGNWAVAYQRPSDGAVKTANSSHWEVSDEAVKMDAVADNSSLAIIPTRDGPYLSNLNLVTQGLSADTTGTMQLSSFDDTWDFDDREILIADVPVPSKKQHFAATMWDNWTNYLYLALLEGGQMSGVHYDGDDFNSIDKINFSGGPERNFTAITMTYDATLFAISNDEILEYSVDTSFPSNLRFVGKVFP